MYTIERREAIQQIKKEQNSLAMAIRHMKAARKGGWTDWHHCHALSCLQSTFRHRHVAWSIIKGSKLEAVDSGKGLNVKAVDDYAKLFRARLGIEDVAA